MSLAQVINKSVSTTMDGLGDVRETVQYIDNGVSSYDPATGTSTGPSSTRVIKAMVRTVGNASLPTQSNESRREHSGQLSVFFSSEGLRFTPTTAGEVIRKGQKYGVAEVIFGLAGSSYRLIVERKG